MQGHEPVKTRWVRKRKRMSATERMDPSRTNGILRQYTADLNRRWRRIQQLITETIVTNDALRLDNPGTVLPVAAAQAARPFQFRSDPAGKVEDFLVWLNDALDDEVLEVTRGPRGRISSNSRWQSVYVRASYAKGLEHAKRELRKAKIPVLDEDVRNLFRAPVHADSLSLLYSRSFQELDGITRATSQRIGRVLTDGLAQGQAPEAIAREMRKAVSDIGIVRSRTLARTEIINAHSTATLNRYADANVQGVMAQAEFLTAQDDLVCPICAGLETGEAIPIDEARGVIPVHPNCLPGDALVSARGDITSATKRWYDGDMVVIECAGSLPLSVTPNHPILTSQGWIAASGIDVGDEIANPGFRERVTGSDGYDVEVPSCAEDVAEAFFSSGKVVAVEVPVSTPDFHGDGGGSHVAVVGTNRILRDRTDAVREEEGSDLSFHWRRVLKRAFDVLRSCALTLKAVGDTSNGVVRGGDLHGAPVGTHAIPLMFLSFRPIARDDAVLPEPSSDGSAICLEDLRESEDARAISVEPDDLVFREVVSKGHQFYSGFVYSFETTEGYYIVDGFVSKNCRCVWLPVV